MNHPSSLTLLAVTLSLSSANAGTVIADFNDLNLGAIGELAGQPADTGTGFTSSHWPFENDFIQAIAGDLTAPAASNYIAGQSGAGIALGNSFGARARRLQTRNITTISGDTIWMSALISLNGSDAEGTINFNGIPNEQGGSADLSPSISFGDNGTPGAVGFLLPNEDALANTGDVSQRLDNAVATDGTAHLIVVKIERTEGDDTLSLWLDPLDVTDETTLGTATLVHTGPYFSNDPITALGYEVVREDDPAGDPSGGLALLDNLKVSDAINALDVVTKSADPVLPGAELTIAALPTFPALVDSPTTSSSILTLENSGNATTIEVTGLIFGGTNASAFTSAQTFPLTIAAGASADIVIAFDSSGVSGSYFADLSVESDAPNEVATVPLVATFAQQGDNLLLNGDFEENNGALPGWILNLNGSGAFAVPGIAPDSTVAANLAAGGALSQNIEATADWYTDFFFVAPDTETRALNFRIFAAPGNINVRFEGTSDGAPQVWNAYDNNPAGENDDWGQALDLPAVQPGAVYFMRVIGHGWGSAEPSYDLLLSEPGGTALINSVEGLTRFQNATVEVPPTELRFSAEFFSDGDITVDDVRFANGQAPPVDLELRILSHALDLEARTFSVTWSSQSGLSYALQYSDDLKENWLDVDDIVATGPETTMTHAGVDISKRFYRVIRFE
ncbi:hypothetical protein V2O64_25425 (plasmid) [Verrucomicrobiaceae bacterium 227]